VAPLVFGLLATAGVGAASGPLTSAFLSGYLRRLLSFDVLDQKQKKAIQQELRGSWNVRLFFGLVVSSGLVLFCVSFWDGMAEGTWIRDARYESVAYILPDACRKLTPQSAAELYKLKLLSRNASMHPDDFDDLMQYVIAPILLGTGTDEERLVKIKNIVDRLEPRH